MTLKHSFTTTSVFESSQSFQTVELDLPQSYSAAQKCPKSFSFLFRFPFFLLECRWWEWYLYGCEYLPTFFIMKRSLLWYLDYIIWYIDKNNNQNYTRRHRRLMRMRVQNTTYQHEAPSKEFYIPVRLDHLQSLENKNMTT